MKRRILRPIYDKLVKTGMLDEKQKIVLEKAFDLLDHSLKIGDSKKVMQAVNTISKNLQN